MDLPIKISVNVNGNAHELQLSNRLKQLLATDVLPSVMNGTPDLRGRPLEFVLGQLITELLKSYVRQHMEL